MLRRSIPLVAVLALGVAAPAASAEPTGSYDPVTDVLAVTVPAAGDQAALVVDAGPIRLNGAAITGGPTVLNTDAISVTVTTGGGSRVVLDQRGGSFLDGGFEIPVTVNGGAGFDELRIEGKSTSDAINVGALGINVIGADDHEITLLPDVDFVDVDGGIGSDTITSAGGAGTGAPSSRPVRFVGGAGNDTMTGSTPPDALFGDAGEDELSGGNGADVLRGGADDDVLNGGLLGDGLDGGLGDDELHGDDGNDVLENSDGNDLLDGGGDVTIGQVGDRVQHETMMPTGGVTLDLAVAGQQATGGAGTDTLVDIEDLGGTAFDDVLRGDGDDNVLDGRNGNDVISGGAGQETVTGGNGNDTLVLGANQDTANAGAGADFVDSADGGFDAVDCGVDADTFSADAGDSLTGCEGSTGGGGGGGVIPPGPTPPEPREELRVALTAKRAIKARKGSVSFKLGCPAVAAGSCRITATLRAKVGKRTRKLGAGAVTLDPGAERTVKVKLTSSGRRLLRSKRKLKATIRITVRDDVGAGRTLTRKFTLKR